MASINIAGILLLSLFLFVTNPSGVQSQLSVKEADLIERSVELTKVLVDNLAKREYRSTIVSIGRTVGPYLGTIAPMLGIVLAVLPKAPSEEVIRLKRLQKSLDDGFKRTERKLGEVMRTVVWSQFNIRFGKMESDIRSNLRYLSYVENSSDRSRNIRKNDFIRHYETSNHDAGGKLFDSIMNTNQVFSSNIPQAVMKYKLYHRKQFRDFMCGLMSLLLASSRLEMSYYYMKNSTSVMREQQKVWVDRMNRVAEKIKYFDGQVTNEYHRQSRKDIDKVAADNEGTSNKNFLRILQRFLGNKFPWRDWFVVVYDDISGGNNHWVGTCNGHIMFRKFGRNIVVASKLKEDTRKLNIGNSKKRLQGIKTRGSGWFWNVFYDAKAIFNKGWSGCKSKSTSIFGVVKRYKDLWVGPGNRVALVTRERYNIFEMG